MAFTDPTENVAQFELQSGAHVADLGAGSGAYSFALARAVGGSGRVYAVEVQKELLTRLKEESRKLGLGNIEVIWADIEKVGGTKLREHSQDACVASNVLFLMPDKENFVKEVKRILKPKGKVLVIDQADSYGGLGPTPEHIFSKIKAQALFEKEGFSFVKDIQAGDHHYGFVMKI